MVEEREPTVIDGETGKPQKPQRLTLATLREVRREMARLYRKVDRGEMDSSESNKRVWHLRQIGDLIEIAEVQHRLIELEKQMKLDRSTLALTHG